MGLYTSYSFTSAIDLVTGLAYLSVTLLLYGQKLLFSEPGSS